MSRPCARGRGAATLSLKAASLADRATAASERCQRECCSNKAEIENVVEKNLNTLLKKMPTGSSTTRRTWDSCQFSNFYDQSKGLWNKIDNKTLKHPLCMKKLAFTMQMSKDERMNMTDEKLKGLYEIPKFKYFRYMLCRTWSLSKNCRYTSAILYWNSGNWLSKWGACAHGAWAEQAYHECGISGMLTKNWVVQRNKPTEANQPGRRRNTGRGRK